MWVEIEPVCSQNSVAYWNQRFAVCNHWLVGTPVGDATTVDLCSNAPSQSWRPSAYSFTVAVTPISKSSPFNGRSLSSSVNGPDPIGLAPLRLPSILALAFPVAGRPKITDQIHDLIRRLGEENSIHPQISPALSSTGRGTPTLIDRAKVALLNRRRPLKSTGVRIAALRQKSASRVQLPHLFQQNSFASVHRGPVCVGD